MKLKKGYSLYRIYGGKIHIAPINNDGRDRYLCGSLWGSNDYKIKHLFIFQGSDVCKRCLAKYKKLTSD